MKITNQSNWLRNQQTQELIAEIESEGKTAVTTSQGGKNRGTFVCKELVIHYAMWISPEFSHTTKRSLKMPQKHFQATFNHPFLKNSFISIARRLANP
ncbi:KilA-N domain-containing protein [Kingella negevensis]|uniref:KilA-N domain-containing protein n=1 Tax=Kingella negevensis TaxID=1522312 RepID=UPI0006944C5F|nr:KilA-N domain-containing protein [Kingella negevensis]WII91783.1 KilA-N domain-containing protein [Kingella negevensis]